MTGWLWNFHTSSQPIFVTCSKTVSSVSPSLSFMVSIFYLLAQSQQEFLKEAFLAHYSTPSIQQTCLPSQKLRLPYLTMPTLLASSPHYPTAVTNLQIALDKVYVRTWCWKILFSDTKSVNTTFTLRPRLYHPIHLDIFPPYPHKIAWIGLTLSPTFVASLSPIPLITFQ